MRTGAGALALSSTGATGELKISGSVVSGRIEADQGLVVLSDSSFSDSEPMVMAGSNAYPDPDPNPNPNPYPDPN